MMNERIRELAERAHKDVRSDEEANGVCFKDYHLQFQKAFAKLLILECGVALSPMLRDMVSRGQAFDLIKKHFGVEE